MEPEEKFGEVFLSMKRSTGARFPVRPNDILVLCLCDFGDIEGNVLRRGECRVFMYACLGLLAPSKHCPPYLYI